MIRFFSGPSEISGSSIRLREENAAHIRSLRLRPDELFTVCDGEGLDHICRLGDKFDGSEAVIIESRPSLGEPSVACTVFIALAKGDRLDYAVQKSVELGAYDIVLFPCERCVSVPDDISRKTERLQRISLETAKQCGRGRVPAVSAVSSFQMAIRRAAPCDSDRAFHVTPHGGEECGERASFLSLFLYECEDTLHLKQALEGRGAFDRVTIMTGPEGGFESFEAESAKEAGMVTVSLGPRILRCETAPVAALAAVMFHTGNL